MIRQPKVGQRVQLWYRDHDRVQHGLYGTVACVGKGQGPKNVDVLLDKLLPGPDGTWQQLTVVVARGNLRPAEENMKP